MYTVYTVYTVYIIHMYIVWAIQVGQEIGQLRRKRIEIEEAKEIAFPSATKTSSKGRPYQEFKKKKQWTLMFLPPKLKNIFEFSLIVFNQSIQHNVRKALPPVE